MAIAAVPDYMGTDFHDASPGLRFSYFLSVWTDDGQWRLDAQQRLNAFRPILTLTPSDKKRMSALAERQSAQASAVPTAALLTLEARAVAPFTTGLGNEHPLENGFAFLNPYGLPYLPGSGVKGVLRRAAEELANGEWGDTFGWTAAKVEELFGHQGDDNGEEADAWRGALQFWDVYPQLAGDQLTVEIMTPHQGHYLQGGETPHDSGGPNPILFLAVPPQSVFSFNVRCDEVRLSESLREGNAWKALMADAFEHAFEWLGFGAKTAVGYGNLARDMDLEQDRTERQEKARNQARLDALSPEERAEEEARTKALELIDGVRKRLAQDQQNNLKEAGGELAQRRLRLLEEALTWESAELRQQAVEVLNETVRWLPWPKKRAKACKADMARLRGEG